MAVNDRAKRNTWRRKNAKIERYALIQDLGGRCNRCGEDDVRVLDFDHIDDDGSEHRRNNKTRNAQDLVKLHPHKFQILCKNCNWLKELNRRKRAVQESIAAQLNGNGSQQPEKS